MVRPGFSVDMVILTALRRVRGGRCGLSVCTLKYELTKINNVGSRMKYPDM